MEIDLGLAARDRHRLGACAPHRHEGPAECLCHGLGLARGAGAADHEARACGGSGQGAPCVGGIDGGTKGAHHLGQGELAGAGRQHLGHGTGGFFQHPFGDGRVDRRYHFFARAFGLHQHAAVLAGQFSHGQLVGQRAGGQEDGRLLAQARGELGFQGFDDATAGVVVGREVGALHGFFEQGGVFARGQCQAVGIKVHVLEQGLLLRCRNRRRCRQQARGRGQRTGGEEVTTIHVCSGAFRRPSGGVHCSVSMPGAMWDGQCGFLRLRARVTHPQEEGVIP